MNLEEAVRDNTAALIEVRDLLKESNVGRAAALEAISTSGAAPKATRAKAADKPAAAVDYTGDKGFEALKALGGAYMAVDDPAEREARKAIFARALVAAGGKMAAGADKVKLPDVPEAKRGLIAGWLIALTKGEDVPELAEPEPAATEEDDMLG